MKQSNNDFIEREKKYIDDKGVSLGVGISIERK